MPGMEAARSYPDLRQPEAAAPKTLHAIDARCAPGSPVTELAPLTAVAAAAVRAGGGQVLDTSHVIFPNGAITLVLILAESHLSIHTWPEEDLVAIDLFSCGAIDADGVIGYLVRELRLVSVTARRLQRGQPDAAGPHS